MKMFFSPDSNRYYLQAQVASSESERFHVFEYNQRMLKMIGMSSISNIPCDVEEIEEAPPVIQEPVCHVLKFEGETIEWYVPDVESGSYYLYFYNCRGAIWGRKVNKLPTSAEPSYDRPRVLLKKPR